LHKEGIKLPSSVVAVSSGGFRVERSVLLSVMVPSSTEARPLDLLPDHLKKVIRTQARYEGLLDQGAKGRELNWLFFDWSNYPLFLNNKPRLEKIKQAQMKSLKAVLTFIEAMPNNRSRINSEVKNFLNESGIYEAINESLKWPP